jgi:hypothetical protein
MTIRGVTHSVTVETLEESKLAVSNSTSWITATSASPASSSRVEPTLSRSDS